MSQKARTTVLAVAGILSCAFATDAISQSTNRPATQQNAPAPSVPPGMRSSDAANVRQAAPRQVYARPASVGRDICDKHANLPQCS